VRGSSVTSSAWRLWASAVGAEVQHRLLSEGNLLVTCLMPSRNYNALICLMNRMPFSVFGHQGTDCLLIIGAPLLFHYSGHNIHNSVLVTITVFYWAMLAAELDRLVARVARVTAGLAESNGILLPGSWLTSPAGWLPRTRISSGTLSSAVEHGYLYLLRFSR